MKALCPKSPMNMASNPVYLIFVLLINCVSSYVLPEEILLVTRTIFLSIPPVRKGTDSRLGAGFRLGEHADFQILVELGPQQETEPIGSDADTKRKRAAMFDATLKGEYGPLSQAIAQYQMQRKIERLLEMHQAVVAAEPVTIKNDPKEDTDDQDFGNNWLSKWSKGRTEASAESSVGNKISSRKRQSTMNRMKVVF